MFYMCRYLWTVEDSIRSPETKVTDSGRMSGIHASKQTLDLWKSSSKYSKLLSHLPNPTCEILSSVGPGSQPQGLGAGKHFINLPLGESWC